jgi:Methyltransferase domain
MHKPEKIGLRGVRARLCMLVLPRGRADTRAMEECCGRPGYEATFSDRFARRIARRYSRHGLNKTQQRLVDFLTERGIEDASVLEIGGGVGEVHLELLRRGAGHVTNTEISTSYERQASELLGQSGLADRVTRRFVDIADAPDDVEAADVVLLHRVVCCYPDYGKLLSAAGSHARRLLVFSYPPAGLLTRLVMGWDNLLRRLRGNDFRSFVHPPGGMVAVLEAQGLQPTYRHQGWAWCVVGLERTPGHGKFRSTVDLGHAVRRTGDRPASGPAS